MIVLGTRVDGREDAADKPHVVAGGPGATSIPFDAKALLMARMLATILVWLSITPLGWLVEPEVYGSSPAHRGGSRSIQRSTATSASSSVAISGPLQSDHRSTSFGDSRQC
jgi:hypothetical protein